MKKIIAPLCLALLLGGCATGSAIKGLITSEQFAAPIVEENKFLKKKENKLLPPAGGPIPVAVYGFQDKTGQRKSVTGIASLSSAVTQGAENYLIESLQTVGDQRWFTVVERVGLDNLIKERQMIRQMREQESGDAATPLPALKVAGVILEGGIIDYNSDVKTGGNGIRYLGIGPHTQYIEDTVVINMRLVSVQTGEILTSVTVSKNLLSTSEGITAFRFFNIDTQAFELDAQQTRNEPGNYAIRSAIEAGVVELIKSGEQKDLWHFKPTQEKKKK